METTKKRIAVLLSGSGKVLKALCREAKKRDTPFEIVIVISNRPGVEGLKRAERFGIPTQVMMCRQIEDRESYDRQIDNVLQAHGVDLVCLSGFLRILSAWFVNQWRGRIISSHPSLLPSFKGLGVQSQVLRAGVRINGCTIYFVEPEVDAGPIIEQATVPVFFDDNEDTLADRVVQEEERLYPKVLDWIASGKILLNKAGKIDREID